MYEVEEQLDKANAILKKEKEARTSAWIKLSRRVDSLVDLRTGREEGEGGRESFGEGRES